MASGVGLKSILASLLGIHPSRTSRITLPAELENQRFDVKAITQNDQTEGFRPMIVNALEHALGIKIKRVPREMEVYVLTAPKELTGSLRLSKAKSFHLSGADGVSAAAAADLDKLAVVMEMVLHIPVIDETKLQGKFDWDLLYDGNNPQSIIGAVRKEFGLELTLAKRPVEMIVVEK
jgi:uncharacterized protein (TIGR03435 family)